METSSLRKSCTVSRLADRQRRRFQARLQQRVVALEGVDHRPLLLQGHQRWRIGGDAGVGLRSLFGGDLRLQIVDAGLRLQHVADEGVV